jgi:hypothetical protein
MSYATYLSGAFSIEPPLSGDDLRDLISLANDGGCRWRPTADGRGLSWDGETERGYVEDLERLLERFLRRRGYMLRGAVRWQGQDPQDRGLLCVLDGLVFAFDEASPACLAAGNE